LPAINANTVELAGRTPIESAPAVERFETAGVVTVSSAHFFHDTYTAFLAPLLPVLIANLSLTKTAAGLLSVFYQLPSLLQPLVGHLGDRVNLKILVIIAPTVAAGLMTLLGVTPTYALLALLLVVAGLNSAGLHAIGPVIVGTLSGKWLGRGMSFWMVAGELARTLGPLVLVSTVALLTPRGLPWLVFGGVAASLVLYLRLRNAPDYRPPAAKRLAWGSAIQSIRPLVFILVGLILTRGLVFASLTTFLPTYLTESGAGLWLAGASLSVMEAAGVVGALFGGVISDRLGRRRVMIVMSLAAPLAVLLFVNVHGWLQFPVLMLVGLTLLSTGPVILALVQEQARGSRALANGVYMALNFALTSLSTLLVGILSDRFGLQAAFMISAGVMLLGMPFVLKLPGEAAGPEQAPPVQSQG
jgi:FSR family fosmidomycin resistance protein-like MFS transporter